MKSTESVLIFVLAVAVTLPVKCTADTPTPVKFYTVDLDLPEHKRWDHIMKDYAEDVKYIHQIISDIFPKDLIPLVEQIAAAYDKKIEDPYANEMRGLAKALNISLGDVVFLNIIYDVSAFSTNNTRRGKACTSIVAEDVNGQIWHVRNLDYGFVDILRKVVLGVHFQTGGTTTYSAITFAGYVGVLTGQKPHGYTVTIDERDQGSWWMNALIGLLDPNAVPIGFLIRDTLASFAEFGSAVDHLAQTDTIAPAYFILGGVRPRQGVVITKARIGADDLWYIGAEKNYSSWFVLETNYDHWDPPPQSDDRRDPAIKAMKQMGRQNVSVQNLFSVISTPPVKNNSTAYSVVMSAAQPSLLQAWVRYPV